MNPGQQHPEPHPDLLATVRFGGLLARLLRLLVGADRREEFLGDLVEEGNLLLRAGSRQEIGAWLWSQTLRSAPALVGLRLRRLIAGSPRWQPAAQGFMVASRPGRRWPLSLAASVSISAHALLLSAATGWVLYRVEATEHAWIPLDFEASVLPDPPAVTAPPAAPLAVEPAPLPRVRQGRRAFNRSAVARPAAPAPAAPPAAADTPGPDLARETPTLTSAAASPAALWGTGAGGMAHRDPPPLRLPPKVGEKRCLSCPTPQLPPLFARFAVGKEMLVKTCVGTKGRVASVDVLQGFDPAVDARVIEAIRGWRLAPYALNGHAVPFCYTTHFRFTTH